MITNEYCSHINAREPKNYFERWYSDMWRKNFRHSQNVQNSAFWIAMKNDLSEVGATITEDNDSTYWTVTFERDEDYTFFVLKWS